MLSVLIIRTPKWLRQMRVIRMTTRQETSYDRQAAATLFKGGSKYNTKCTDLTIVRR